MRKFKISIYFLRKKVYNLQIVEDNENIIEKTFPIKKIRYIF
ncbi:Protein of unknown function [Clostridium neonatale]|nr:Protein of unknown function [Clostridium neonatale]